MCGFFKFWICGFLKHAFNAVIKNFDAIIDACQVINECFLNV